jgi:hypothetical protein
MNDQPSTIRYSLVDPVSNQPTEQPAPQGRVRQSVQYLTWAILSVCLGLWAVIGFLFWIPLLVRSMLHFSVALIQSMLEGTRPVEAGRVLRETVDFYRRGFMVAIGAVFGNVPTPGKPERRMTAKRFIIETGWAVLVWYLLLLAVGVVETSPLDVWDAAAEYPWGDLFGDIGDAVTSFFEGGGTQPTEGTTP